MISKKHIAQNIFNSIISIDVRSHNSVNRIEEGLLIVQSRKRIRNTFNSIEIAAIFNGFGKQPPSL